MGPSSLVSRCPSACYLGAAKLHDHRLAFTRRSIQWEAGAADALAAPGHVIWGALYDLDETDLDVLDEREGRGRAYDLEAALVVLEDGTERDAVLYRVMKPSPQEILPSREYVDAIRSGAQEAELPPRYRAFLDSVADELNTSADRDFRGGFAIRITERRKGAAGMPLVSVPPGALPGIRDGGLAAVSRGHHTALAQVAIDRDCERETCGLDQAVRHALGLPGREIYGATVYIDPVRGRISPAPFIRPRVLVLPMWPPSWLDSEKQIVILHPHTLRLLGLDEGDSVKVVSVVREGDSYRLQSLTRRAWPGSEPKVHRRGKMVDYPKVAEVYVDLDGRKQLGVDVEGYPVCVRPDVARLFFRRVLVYGLALGLAAAGLAQPIDQLAAGAGLSNAYAGVLTLALAAALTVLLVFLDLRARVNY